MIISVEELTAQVDCGDMSDIAIQRRLASIEAVIRKYTNNSFQNRSARFEGRSDNGIIYGTSPYIRAGDTVQITQSKVNDGLYVVDSVADGYITVDRDIYDVPRNRVTKIEYPPDIVDCAIKLFEWQSEYGSKIGIKSESETLSRHSTSVTYEDSSSLYMGYPTGLLSGLALYKKSRSWE